MSASFKLTITSPIGEVFSWSAGGIETLSDHPPTQRLIADMIAKAGVDLDQAIAAREGTASRPTLTDFISLQAWIDRMAGRPSDPHAAE